MKQRAGTGAESRGQAELAWLRAPALGVMLLAGGLAGCSRSNNPEVPELPGFQDISSAPSAIEHSARAVVRIETATESGTGSFISESGLLLTNNHVLGAPICPREGCVIHLSVNYQRGAARQAPIVAFAVPQAVDLGLDVATLQVYEQKGGAPLESPNFLNFDPRSAQDLLGSHVFVVGHPEASLKRWTEGTVVDSDGQWFQSTAFTLPGDSGSPALDDQGNIVGLIHRGPTGEDLGTRDGLNVFSIGTPSADVMAAASAPLPDGMLSISAKTSAADVLANDLVYLNGQAVTASIAGKATSVVSVLGQACDAALARNDFASIDEIRTAQQPCVDAMRWLECRTDLDSPPLSAVCLDAAQWADRFQKLNEAWRALNGQVDLDAVSFAIAELSATRGDGLAAGQASLLAALAEAQTPLDLSLAAYLAAFGVQSYQGQAVDRYVLNYRQVTHYELSGSSIANAAGWLYDNGSISRAQFGQVLGELDGDARVSLGTKLEVEELQYDFGLL